MCLETGEEVVHAEIENFGAMADTHGDHMGMAVAGTEEQVIRKLHNAGSIDASDLLPDLVSAQIAAV